MKRWLKRLILGLVLSLFLSVAGILWSWYSTRNAGLDKLTGEVARLDEADPGWRLHDINDVRNSSLPPDDRNGAVVVQRAVAIIPKAFDHWSKESSDRMTEGDRNRLPDPATLTELGPILKASRPAIDLLNSVPTLPPGGNRLVIAEPNPLDTVLESTQRMRQAVHLLAIHALAASANGDSAVAVDDVRAMLAVARCVGDEPFLISQLVRIALSSVAVNTTEAVLGLSEPKTGLTELRAALAAEISVPRFAVGLRGERAMFHRLTENLDSGALPIDGLDGNRRKGNSGGGLGVAHFRQYIPEQQALSLELFGEYLAATGKGFAERRAAGDAIERRIRGMTDRKHALIHLLFPAVNRVGDSDARIVAQLGCAAAAVACEQYRQQSGSWPDSLDAMPKDLLTAVPDDPFSGRPLRYKRTATGAVVYSVGRDGADDGGGTLDPKMTTGTDVGFRLFDPSHRRLPPKPPTDDEDHK